MININCCICYSYISYIYVVYVYVIIYNVYIIHVIYHINVIDVINVTFSRDNSQLLDATFKDLLGHLWRPHFAPRRSVVGALGKGVGGRQQRQEALREVSRKIWPLNGVGLGEFVWKAWVVSHKCLPH